MNSPKSIFIMLSKGSLLFVIISTFLPFMDGYTITEISENLSLLLIFAIVSILITVYTSLRNKNTGFRLESLLLDTTLWITISLPLIVLLIILLESGRKLETGSIFAIIGLISSLVFLSIAASFKDTLTEEEKLIKQKKKYTAITLLLYLVPAAGQIYMGNTFYSQRLLIISGIISIFLLIVSIKRKFQLKEIVLISLPLIISILFLFGFGRFDYFSSAFRDYGYYSYDERVSPIKQLLMALVKLPLLQIVICLGPAAIASRFTRKQK